MRVIIADDEEKICQLIYALVDWKAMDMTVEAIVHNGIETLEAIQKYHPDIVITDIRMPGYDGLEMIKRAKEINDNIDFIIISGYRHFEYAQSAIRYGVKDYLLKPIKKSELIDTLSRMRLEYLERTEKLSMEEKVKISMMNNQDKVRQTFLINMIQYQNECREESSIAQINEEYCFAFDKGIFQIVLIKIDSIDFLAPNNREYIQEKVLQAIQKKLREECFEIESCFVNNGCYVLINYGEHKKKEIRHALKALLDELLLQKDILENIRVTIGAGVLQEEVQGLLLSAKSASRAIEQRLILGVNKIIDGILNPPSELGDSEIFYEFNKRLGEALERLEEKNVEAAFAYLETSLENKSNITGHEIVQMAKEAINLYLLSMRQNKLSVMEADTLFERFSFQLEYYSSIHEIFAFAMQTVMQSFKIAVSEKKQEDNKPIREAKQYIMDHFKEAITLELVSDQVGFNTTYFSVLFKKETGKTFSEYMTERRMEKAKELLRESNLSVALVCEEVGYYDIKHFTKSFTKYTNLKPNEYRKIYS